MSSEPIDLEQLEQRFQRIIEQGRRLKLRTEHDSRHECAWNNLRGRFDPKSGFEQRNLTLSFDEWLQIAQVLNDVRLVLDLGAMCSEELHTRARCLIGHLQERDGTTTFRPQ